MLLFLIVLLIVFSIPSVQTFVAKKVTSSMNASKNVDITVGRVGITYSGKFVLDDVLIRDHHKDTLIFANRVKTSVTSFKSLWNNNPTLGSTTAADLHMHMKIYEGENRDNLKIFLQKLKSQKKQKSASFIMTAS
ncbi:MAG: hypothetical protein WBL21_06725, partial [Salinimicrobium sp.]